MDSNETLDLFGDFGSIGAGSFSPDFGDAYAYADLAPYGSLDSGGGFAPIEQLPVQFMQPTDPVSDFIEQPTTQYEVGNSPAVTTPEKIEFAANNPGGAGPMIDFTSVGDSGGDLSALFQTALATLGNALQSGPIIGVGAGGGVIDINRRGSIVVNARNCPVGYHQPKNYGRTGGSTKPCVKNRHMNPLNPKALMRATRRMAGFHHFANRIEKQIQHALRKAGVRGPRRIGGRCGTCRKTKCSC